MLDVGNKGTGIGKLLLSADRKKRGAATPKTATRNPIFLRCLLASMYSLVAVSSVLLDALEMRTAPRPHQGGLTIGIQNYILRVFNLVALTGLFGIMIIPLASGAPLDSAWG